MNFVSNKHNLRFKGLKLKQKSEGTNTFELMNLTFRGCFVVFNRETYHYDNLYKKRLYE